MTSREESQVRRCLLLVGIAGLPAVVYAVGVAGLSAATGTPPLDVPGFDPLRFPQASMGERAASVAAPAGACGSLFIAPGLLGFVLFRAGAATRAAAPVWSLALNSAGLIAVCLVLRTAGVLNRPAFYSAWLVWTAGLAGAAWRRGEPRTGLGLLWSRSARGVFVGLITVAIGIGLFWQDQFLQCFNGDGTESAELARSLREHFLPTWEIEPIDRFGAVIVNPALVNSYWTLGVQLLLGEDEFAARVSYWVWWFGIVLVSDRIQRHLGRSGWGPALLVALGALLSAVWYTFYTGYDTYMADLANPGVPDALFTLCVLLAFDSLLRQSMRGWVVGMVLASLVLYAGPVTFVLTAAAALVWRPVERRRMLRGTLTGIGMLGVIAGLYVLWGWLDGLLEGWWITLSAEYVNDYFAPLPRARSGLLYAGYFVLGCGGVPALGLVTGMRSSAWQRTLATLVLVYLAIVMGSAAKNLHYLGPLLPLAVVLWTVRSHRSTGLRPVRSRVADPHGARKARVGDPCYMGRVSAGTFAAAISLGLALALCWPRLRPTFTLTRELGAQTTYQTDSYQEACRWADLAIVYDLGITSWFVGPHTWVGYSHLEAVPTERRPLLVTMAERPPEGYAVRGRSATGVTICIDLRDLEWLRWATNRRPAIGPERFPWILREVAPLAKPRLRLELAE